MARQLILCCDGTNNNLTGRLDDTNVTKLCELLSPDREDQLLWYDPGVGNPGELPGTTVTDRVSRRLQRIYGLAFGKGIYENIAEGYTFLMRNYRAGDEIYLYGFSRGAFTARSIGGLVTLFGLLRPGMEALVPTLLHTYFADRQKTKRYENVAAQISDLFCADTTREVSVWFVGVWDTVASVGAPLLGRQTITAKPSIVGKRYHHVRQALALDEHRVAFEPRPYIIEPDHDYAANGQSIRQLWFAGSHCDVGGGYVNAEAARSDDALVWMLQESVDCGLRLRAEVRLNAATTDGQGAPPATLDPDRAMAFLRERSGTASTTPVARIHSETYTTAWWALAGLRVRDPSANPDWNHPEVSVRAAEHLSVEARGAAYPADTVWSQARPRRAWIEAAVVALLCWCLAGAMLTAPLPLDSSSLGALFESTGDALTAVTKANLHLAEWQVGWVPWHHLLATPWPSPTEAGGTFDHLGGALLADLGLIASYGYLLALAMSRAFARLARLRRVGQAPASPWLNLLGLSARTAVLADIAEDAFTLLWQKVAGNELAPSAEWLVGLAMTGASVMKWVGLAGALALIAWSMLPVQADASAIARKPVNTH